MGEEQCKLTVFFEEPFWWSSVKITVRNLDRGPQGNATRAQAASMVQRFCEAVTVEK